MVRRMSIVKSIQQSIDKTVIVGIQHTYDEHKLFFYKGKLLTADDKLLEIQTSKGNVIISLDRIKEFRVER